MDGKRRAERWCGWGRRGAIRPLSIANSVPLEVHWSILFRKDERKTIKMHSIKYFILILSEGGEEDYKNAFYKIFHIDIKQRRSGRP